MFNEFQRAKTGATGVENKKLDSGYDESGAWKRKRESNQSGARTGAYYSLHSRSMNTAAVRLENLRGAAT